MSALRRPPQNLDCVEFVELVTDYLEAALAEEDVRAFEHHVSICEGCKTYLEQMRETMRLTGKLEVGDIPQQGTAPLLDAFRAYWVERREGPPGAA